MMRNYIVNVFCIVSILELDCFLKTQRQFLRKNYKDQFANKNWTSLQAHYVVYSVYFN